MTNIDLNRRRFVAGLSAVMGASFVSLNAIAIEAAANFHSGVRAKVLISDHLQMVKIIGEIIIPRTDTPGAIDADVHGYIDYMVADFMTEKAQKAFFRGLKALDRQAGGFLKLDAAAQEIFIAELDNKAYSKGGKEKYGFYRSLKNWITTGYFTSKEGMTEARTYNPFPGPLREVTKQEWLEYNGWA